MKLIIIYIYIGSNTHMHLSSQLENANFGQTGQSNGTQNIPTPTSSKAKL